MSITADVLLVLVLNVTLIALAFGRAQQQLNAHDREIERLRDLNMNVATKDDVREVKEQVLRLTTLIMSQNGSCEE